VKFVDARPYADPDVAARKLVELANAVEPYFNNRILIEKINGPFLYDLRGSPDEYWGREVDEERTDREMVVRDLLEGQYSCPGPDRCFQHRRTMVTRRLGRDCRRVAKSAGIGMARGAGGAGRLSRSTCWRPTGAAAAEGCRP
jgi:hypothetical protein